MKIFDCYNGGSSAWTPDAMFSAGQLGCYYDVASATKYQDAAGTIPAVVGGPVGRLIDQSGRGITLVQATDGARPILRASGGVQWLEITSGKWLATTVDPLGGQTALAYIWAATRAGSPAAAIVASIGVGSATLKMHAVSESYVSPGYYVYSNAVDVTVNATVQNWLAEVSEFHTSYWGVAPGAKLVYRRNGIQREVTQPSNIVARTGGAGFRLGGRPDFPASSQVDICAFILRATAPSAEEMTFAEAWCSSKAVI